MPSAYGRRPSGGVGVTHRKDKAEEQAIALLQRVVAMSEADRDALPGSAVRHVKLAIAIMRKRRKRDTPASGRPDPADG
jgi:hypothetical protein